MDLPLHLFSNHGCCDAQAHNVANEHGYKYIYIYICIYMYIYIYINTSEQATSKLCLIPFIRVGGRFSYIINQFSQQTRAIPLHAISCCEDEVRNPAAHRACASDWCRRNSNASWWPPLLLVIRFDAMVVFHSYVGLPEDCQSPCISWGQVKHTHTDIYIYIYIIIYNYIYIYVYIYRERVK